MAYNTPELLLVGAAQNLVMGEIRVKISGPSDQFVDADTVGYVDLPDSTSW